MASGKHAFANTDWQLAQIREGRVSTKLTAEEEAAAALLQSVTTTSHCGPSGSQPSSGMVSPQVRSRHASRAASRRATATSRINLSAALAVASTPPAAEPSLHTETESTIAPPMAHSIDVRDEEEGEEEEEEPQSSLHFLDLEELAKQQQQQQLQPSDSSPPTLADHLVRTAASLVQLEMASLFPEHASAVAAHTAFPHPPPAMPAARPSSAPRRRHLPPKPRGPAATSMHGPSSSFSLRIIHKPLRPASASAVASGAAGLTRPTLVPSTRGSQIDPVSSLLDAASDRAQCASRALVEKLSETHNDAEQARAMVQRLTAPVVKAKPSKRLVRPASAAPVVAVVAAAPAAIVAPAASVVVVDATPPVAAVEQPLLDWDLDRPVDAARPATELLSPSPPPAATATPVPPIASHAALANLANESKPSTPTAFSARTSLRPSSASAATIAAPLRGSLSARLPVPAEEKQGTPEALYLSFDPRRRATQAVRKSLADAAAHGASRPTSAAGPRMDDSSAGVPIASASALPSSPSHPYPPTRAASVSLAVAASHAYVYGSGNRAAGNASAAAMHFLDSHTDVEPGAQASLSQARGSLSARRPPTLSSAAARAQSLLQQLQQFTVQKAKPRVIKALSDQRAYEDFGHYRER